MSKICPITFFLSFKKLSFPLWSEVLNFKAFLIRFLFFFHMFSFHMFSPWPWSFSFTFSFFSSGGTTGRLTVKMICLASLIFCQETIFRDTHNFRKFYTGCSKIQDYVYTFLDKVGSQLNWMDRLNWIFFRSPHGSILKPHWRDFWISFRKCQKPAFFLHF